jgi:predicted dehydrogenase
MKRNIHWGIIGPGRIATKFAADLMLVEGAVLHAVASRDPERGRAFATKFNVANVYDSYDALVSDPALDVVYVATPHVYHFEHTMLCLSHGKAVLCEKPFGMNTHEVRAMIREATDRKVFLMEALWTRFIPGIEKVLALLASDTIGEIQYIRADFGFVGDDDPGKRLFNKSLGGGSLMDVGIYPVFLSLLLLGVPEKIRAMASFTHTGVDRVCGMLFDHKDGKKAMLESSITTNTPTEAMIFGSKGSIKLHRRFFHTDTITITRSDNTEETIHMPLTGTGYYYEILEVMHCLSRHKTQSSKMTHAMSLDLIQTLDRVRSEIGLVY